jgi:acyl carrier protein
MPPLRGVVHAAMVIADGLLRNQDEEGFHKVLAPKVLGARHLHELTRELPLDFFILYSSATTFFGNPGQGNYVAANLYLEALAESRRAQGLPALCLSWGAIDDVGYLARHQDVKDALQSRMGGPALKSDEALQVLEQLLLRDHSGLGVMDLEWATLRRFLPTAGAPKYLELARHAQELGGDAEGLVEIRRLLEELGPEELHTVFVDLLKREVAEILRISPDRLDENRSMYDQGMDSLMGMELVAAVEERFGVNLPIMALSEGPTISRLVERIIRQLKAPESGAEAQGSELNEQVRSMAARHASEADTAAIDEVVAAVEDGGAGKQGLLDRT